MNSSKMNLRRGSNDFAKPERDGIQAPRIHDRFGTPRETAVYTKT